MYATRMNGVKVEMASFEIGCSIILYVMIDTWNNNK